ncbi:ABC transporter permease [Microcoleus sp. FACHB-1515]|uniref:ABC transporter permease n=1 Tax=Cyanophyceae TaxID=3028117 RepID=UPI0016882988|nr:ABC transporter permease [Microcoleus sp. FACHB-1515]MBD2092091.1 ABC transporter permease [Microcoleus sp. FACHB-1515]
MEKFLKSKTAGFVLPFVATIVLLALWELVVIIFKIPPFSLPAPSGILQAMANFAPQLIANSWRTLWTTLVGFVLAVGFGVLLGFMIGYSRIAYLTLYPLLVAFNTIPKAAIVPLLAIWMGANARPAVITAFLLAFFPIAVNVALGLDTVEPEMKDVLRSLGANQVETFQKIGWPHTLPYIFASLKIAASFAFIGTVISESVASNAGLGYLIVQATSSFDIPLAFAALLILALMGVVLYGFFVFVEKKVIYWAR